MYASHTVLYNKQTRLAAATQQHRCCCTLVNMSNCSCWNGCTGSGAGASHLPHPNACGPDADHDVCLPAVDPEIGFISTSENATPLSPPINMSHIRYTYLHIYEVLHDVFIHKKPRYIPKQDKYDQLSHYQRARTRVRRGWGRGSHDGQDHHTTNSSASL